MSRSAVGTELMPPLLCSILAGGRLAWDVMALLTVAGGGLSSADLGELTGSRLTEVGRALREAR